MEVGAKAVTSCRSAVVSERTICRSSTRVYVHGRKIEPFQALFNVSKSAPKGNSCWIAAVDGERRNGQKTTFPSSRSPALEICIVKTDLETSWPNRHTQHNVVRDGFSVPGDSIINRTKVDVGGSADTSKGRVNENTQGVHVENSEVTHPGYAVSRDNGELEEFLNIPGAESDVEVALHGPKLQILADETFSNNKKWFVNPLVVKSGRKIELFLNRSLTTLNNELNVVIKGAFNDWRWKLFTANLNKTALSGDWWSCRIHIPKEAYMMDFVFYNGEELYENNDGNDFCIHVQSEIDEYTFEDFLIEEEHRELLQISEEQAERERHAEEQFKIAEREVDRARARVEVDRRRHNLQQAIEKAVSSVANVWYIEPTDFRGEDIIRIYYNKSSGPLYNAQAIWIHVGYNNWQNQLCDFKRLVKCADKEGDWWYAEGIFFWTVVTPDRALVLDWIFADGPPQEATLNDNNSHQDFHTLTPSSVPQQFYWYEEEQRIYRRLTLESDRIWIKTDREEEEEIVYEEFISNCLIMKGYNDSFI